MCGDLDRKRRRKRFGAKIRASGVRFVPPFPQDAGAFMKIRHPWLIAAAALVGAVVLRVFMATLRFRIVTADGLQHPADPRQARYLYVFWHESLLAPAARPGKVNVLISLHADGELITQVCRYLGIGVVRGSTTRRGGAALLEMVARGRDAHLAITPDGPRGPRRRVQVGAVYIASKAGLPIVPIGIGFSHAWRARSWDRFGVPKPFSRVHAVIGAPITAPSDLDRDGLEQYRQLVERRLLEATDAAEAWALNPATPPTPPGSGEAAAR